MRTMLLWMLAVGCVAAARAEEPAFPTVHPDSSGWDDLLAEDLSNARYPKGVWSFAGGLLTATEDRCVWTKKQFENFVLDLEFKNAEGTNSGVFVYCSDIEKFIPNSVEVQIADDFSQRWARLPKTWHCAAIFGHLAPKKSAVHKPGEWNRMTITCRGPKIHVLLNTEAVNLIDITQWTSAQKNPDGSKIPPWLSKPLAELPTRGHVGFQGKHGGVPITFRNLKIKKLE